MTFKMPVTIVTNSVAMKTVLLTLKWEKNHPAKPGGLSKSPYGRTQWVRYLYYKLEMNVVEVVVRYKLEMNVVEVWPFVRRYLSDSLLLHKTRQWAQSFSMVTNSVAMASVLLTLKGAKGTIRRSRVGYQKSLLEAHPTGALVKSKREKTFFELKMFFICRSSVVV
eukprot:sb/3472454/